MTAVIGTLLLCATLVGVYVFTARSWAIVDKPNQRSAHSRPTPSGGGVGIFLALTLGYAWSVIAEGRGESSLELLLIASLLFMLIGVLDDLLHLPVAPRLACYTLICLGVAFCLFRLYRTEIHFPAWVFVPVLTLIMLWSLNLFNFMDGIDGLAATQTVLACLGAAYLSAGNEAGDSYPLFCLLLAAAHAGFLLWNWPPAKLFMGDAGSVPSGFLLAALAVVGALGGKLNLLCWLVLMAVFVTDATWTLLWRMFTGQAVTRPHRMHAYQRLSRHWSSHRAVDLLLSTIVVLWLYPLAWLVQKWPRFDLILVILAYLPLLVGMAKIRRLE